MVLAGVTVASPPSFTDSSHVQSSQSDLEASSGKHHYCFNFPFLISTSCYEEYFPICKNSENASLLSVDSADSNAARNPSSMPVPTVPRRAGPPRKKPVKPSAPPPEVPEVSEERVEEVIATPATVDELEQKAAEPAIEAPEHEELDHKEIHGHQGEIHDEPLPIDSDVQHESVKGLVAESESAGSKDQEAAHDGHSPFATIEVSDEQEREQEHEHVDVDYPDQMEDEDVMPTRRYDHQSHYEDETIVDHSDEYPDESHADEHHEYQHLQQDEDHHVDVNVEAQPSSAVGVEEEHEDEDAAEEEARRKGVAERLAKMGGINPFAVPLRRSSEETGHAASQFISSHGSSSSVTALPASPPPDVPLRKPSLRSSHGVADPHTLPVVESKVEEQGEAEYPDGE